MKKTSCLLFLLLSVNIFSQSNKELSKLHKAKQFLLLDKENTNRKNPDFYFYKAVFANVCNKAALSNLYLDSFFISHKLPKKMLFQYWVLRNDNYVKLFDYKNAYQTNHTLNTEFKSRYKKDELEGSQQTENIWEALQNTEPQRISFKGLTTVPLSYDMAGLINIPVKCNGTDTNFVFDTGAGISSITQSLANKLKLHILKTNSVSIKGFTGISNQIKIGVADSIRIGDAIIMNPYFLVFNDSALTFANGKYKINGIIGFPIAKELGTITIEPTKMSIENTRGAVNESHSKNLFIEFLNPFILLKFNGVELPYKFDTGASETLFSKSFFQKFKGNSSFSTSKITTTESASAGGSKKYKVYKPDTLNFELSDKKITFKQAEIDIENYHVDGKEIFGNIGQDILKRHQKVIISFDRNYLELVD